MSQGDLKKEWLWVEWVSLVQFARYAISGGLVTLLHMVLFFLVAWKAFPALQEHDIVVSALGVSVAQVDNATRSFNCMLANGVAFTCSNMVAYVLNVCWVFESGQGSRFVEIVLFYLVSGASVLVGTGIIGGLIRWYGVETTYAFSANVVFSLMINYVVRKKLIFRVAS